MARMDGELLMMIARLEEELAAMIHADKADRTREGRCIAASRRQSLAAVRGTARSDFARPRRGFLEGGGSTTYRSIQTEARALSGARAFAIEDGQIAIRHLEDDRGERVGSHRDVAEQLTEGPDERRAGRGWRDTIWAQ